MELYLFMFQPIVVSFCSLCPRWR